MLIGPSHVCWAKQKCWTSFTQNDKIWWRISVLLQQSSLLLVYIACEAVKLEMYLTKKNVLRKTQFTPKLYHNDV